MALSSNIVTKVSAVYSSAADFAVPTQDVELRWTTTFTSGTGSGQADLMWSDERTIAASGTDSLDLTGTAIKDVFGNGLAFVKVKAILVKAAAGNTNNVVVGGAGSNTFVGPFADATDKAVVPPGGQAIFIAPAAGWTVTATTGDLLLIANSGGTTGVTYDILIVGTSA
jgi:hypothetical protein